jgi:hypothetical protein
MDRIAAFGMEKKRRRKAARRETELTAMQIQRPGLPAYYTQA